MKKNRFRDMSLRKKTILISMVSASVSLLVTCLIFFLSERSALTQDKASELLSLSKVIHQEIIETTNLRDGKPRKSLFDSLSDNPDILTACFYDPQGLPLILYHPEKGREGLTPFPFLRAEAAYSHGALKPPTGGRGRGTLYYPRPSRGSFKPPPVPKVGVTYSEGTMKSTSDVQSGGKSLGTLYLEAEIDEIQAMM